MTYVFRYQVVFMGSVMNRSNVFVTTLICGPETIAMKVRIRAHKGGHNFAQLDIDKLLTQNCVKM